VEPCEGGLIVVTVFEIKEEEVLYFSMKHIISVEGQTNGPFLSSSLVKAENP
jgi:hypothetical protein